MWVVFKYPSMEIIYNCYSRTMAESLLPLARRNNDGKIEIDNTEGMSVDKWKTWKIMTHD